MIFATPQKEDTKIWLDPHIPTHTELATLLKANGASISPDHADPSTSIVVLHPSSTTIFDEYCHPAWLSLAGIFRHIKRKRVGGDEACRRKVIVTERWPGACLAAGRYLGEEDDWGGCRQGGPVKRVSTAKPVLVDVPCIRVEQPAAPLAPRRANIPPQPTTSAPPKPIAEPPTGPRAIAGLPAPPNSRRSAAPPALSSAARAPPARLNPPRAPAASQFKPRPLSIVLPADSKPINTPTSKWQAAQTPPRILEGLRFYLDGGRNGRKHTINNIQKSLGEIVAEPHLATHCLLSRVPAAQADERHKFMESATAAGAWCIAYEWLESSWDISRRLDEADFVYEGGTPRRSSARNMELENEEVGEEDAQDDWDGVPTPENPLLHVEYSASGRFPPRTSSWNRAHSTDDLDEILRDAHAMSLMPGKKTLDVMTYLHENHGMTVRRWRDLYTEWLNMEGQFAPIRRENGHIPYTPLFIPHLQAIRGGATIQDIASRLVQSHGIETVDQFKVHLGNWLRTLSANKLPRTNHVPPAERRPDMLAERTVPASKLPRTDPVPLAKRQPEQATLAEPTRTNRAVEERKRAGRERRLLLAPIFKQYENSGLGRKGIAEIAAKKLQYAVPGVCAAFTQWKRRAVPWQDVPEEYQSAERAYDPSPGAGAKRKRGDSSGEEVDVNWDSEESDYEYGSA